MKPKMELEHIFTKYWINQNCVDSPWSVRGARRRSLTGTGASLPQSAASKTLAVPASTPTVRGKTETVRSPQDQQQFLLLEGEKIGRKEHKGATFVNKR